MGASEWCVAQTLFRADDLYRACEAENADCNVSIALNAFSSDRTPNAMPSEALASTLN